MAQPKKFKKVFGAAMVCVAVLMAIVANLCVMAFGEVTNGSVTAFLLEGKFYCIDLYLLFIAALI